MDDSQTQNIERLARSVSDMWLEFQMHRCRITISVPGSKIDSMVDKARKAQEGSLELTIVPSLGRHGNREGSALQTYVTVADCAGESLRLD